MKKGMHILSIIVIVALVLMLPLTAIFVGLSPNVFNQTYFAELPDMVKRLDETKEKKIVIIGSSSVAFGINSKIFEKEMENASLDYSVCNFGLYGVLGTKLMLDLAIDSISEKDIVIISPEMNSQTLSLYFSGEQTWYAIESNPSLFNRIAKENQSTMVGNYMSYVQKKYKYMKNPSYQEIAGVYSHASFDNHCDLVVSRENNIMPDEVDSNNVIELDISLFQRDFIDYLNAYNKIVKSKKATLVYDFSPMNQKGVVNETDIDILYDYLYNQLDFEIIGNPHEAILDSCWFYDSNFHMNSSGSIVNTLRVVDDIKTYLNNTTANVTEYPNKPIINKQELVVEENNEDVDCFEYELLENGTYKIVGLKVKKDSYIVPNKYEGCLVTEIGAESFGINNMIKYIEIPSTIRRISDNSFCGLTNLEKLIINHDSPKDIMVGYGLLNGTNAMIVVKKQAYSSFMGDYTWSYYEKRLTYEE